jgi:hypothetical protein
MLCSLLVSICGMVMVLAASAPAADSYDSHGFEQPHFQSGSIHGQQGWRVVDVGGAEGDAVIVAAQGREGSQALELKNIGRRVVARHAHAYRGTFYADAMLKLPHKEVIHTNVALLLRGRDADNAHGLRVSVAFNGSGSVNDVPASKANRYLPGQWTRVTIKVDFEAQAWSLYLNGVLVGEGLPFLGATSIRQIDTIDINWHSQPNAPGEGLLVDAFSIGTRNPLDSQP